MLALSRRAPVIVTVHSFIPVYGGARRDFDIGILHDADARFADALFKTAEAETEFVIRRNAPYGPRDGATHTLAAPAVAAPAFLRKLRHFVVLKVLH